jgi:hypothetical protein
MALKIAYDAIISQILGPIIREPWVNYTMQRVTSAELLERPVHHQNIE